MSFFQINNYARLTNQEEDTIRFMHLTQFTDQVNIPMFVRSIPGLRWCSTFFNYQILMLENLAPQGPAVLNPPLNGLPPPHLLIGYAYLFNVNNNYRFESRTYTKLNYEADQSTTRRPRNFWSILSDCSYTINTSNVRTIPENYEDNLNQFQEEILINRIRADIESRSNMQGTGVTLQPEAYENINIQNEINKMYVTNLRDFINSKSFAFNQRYQYETEKDINTLKCINYTLELLAKFIYNWQFKDEKIYVPLKDNWLQILKTEYDKWQPLIRRIRRPPPSPVEEEDAGEGPSAGPEEEEMEEELGNEILRIFQNILNELRAELTEPAREHEIFSFGQLFYNLLQRANEQGRVTREFIRRFIFYFFIAEHISSTLFYYHALLNLNVIFRRYVNMQYVQVIMTGRDHEGNVNLHRVWTNTNISPFLRIFRTIINDLLIICDRRPDSIEQEQEEQEDLLTSLSHRPESGDPNDLLNQARLNEDLINTVTLSFKIKPIGLVTIATNRQIINNASAVRTQEMRRLRQPR